MLLRVFISISFVAIPQRQIVALLKELAFTASLLFLRVVPTSIQHRRPAFLIINYVIEVFGDTNRHGRKLPRKCLSFCARRHCCRCDERAPFISGNVYLFFIRGENKRGPHCFSAFLYGLSSARVETCRSSRRVRENQGWDKLKRFWLKGL